MHITGVKNLEGDYDLEVEFSLTTSIGEPSSPNDFIHEITGRILASAEDEDPEQCGLLQAYLIQFDQADACGIDTWDVGDTVCGTVATYWEALFDAETGDWRPDIQRQYTVTNRNLLIVHYVEVNPKFRGHKIAAASVERLVHLFGTGCALVACFPTPVQFLPAFADDLPRLQVANCSEKEAFKKLQDYWLQAGFRPYKKTGICLKIAQWQDWVAHGKISAYCC